MACRSHLLCGTKHFSRVHNFHSPHLYHYRWSPQRCKTAVLVDSFRIVLSHDLMTHRHWWQSLTSAVHTPHPQQSTLPTLSSQHSPPLPQHSTLPTLTSAANTPHPCLNIPHFPPSPQQSTLPTLSSQHSSPSPQHSTLPTLTSAVHTPHPHFISPHSPPSTVHTPHPQQSTLPTLNSPHSPPSPPCCYKSQQKIKMNKQSVFCGSSGFRKSCWKVTGGRLWHIHRHYNCVAHT